MDIRLFLYYLAHDITFICIEQENVYTVNLSIATVYMRSNARRLERVGNRSYVEIAFLTQNDPCSILLKIGTPYAELPVYERRNTCY